MPETNPVPSVPYFPGTQPPTSVAKPPSVAPANTVYALPSATAGVAMNAPALNQLPSISAAIAKACESIPPGKNGALVAVAGANGVNLALVSKIGEDLAITAWIGRSWKKDAATEWGAEVKLTF